MRDITFEIKHGQRDRCHYFEGAASRHVPATGVVDIIAGNNSFAGVTGYDAATGYDLASGWGTINAARFVPALALTAGH